MSRVVLSELAEADFIDIWVFVARDNVEAADRLLDQLHEKCQFLADSPMVGRQRSELDPAIRSFAVGNYVIFYRDGTDGIESRSRAARPSRYPASFPFLNARHPARHESSSRPNATNWVLPLFLICGSCTRYSRCWLRAVARRASLGRGERASLGGHDGRALRRA